MSKRISAANKTEERQHEQCVVRLAATQDSQPAQHPRQTAHQLRLRVRCRSVYPPPTRPRNASTSSVWSGSPPLLGRVDTSGSDVVCTPATFTLVPTVDCAVAAVAV